MLHIISLSLPFSFFEMANVFFFPFAQLRMYTKSGQGRKSHYPILPTRMARFLSPSSFHRAAAVVIAICVRLESQCF